MDERHLVWDGRVPARPPRKVHVVHVSRDGLVLEGDGVVVDHPVPHVVYALGLDPVQRLGLVRAKVEVHAFLPPLLPLGQAKQGQHQDTADHFQFAEMRSRSHRSGVHFNDCQNMSLKFP